ncbi:MAG: serine/threonine-protein kinase [Candidatus Solibacter sp.]
MDRKLNPSFAETVASDSMLGQPARTDASEISRVTSTSSDDEGRFLPGTLLGGRYRIIGLLGRGGMGEVYRATDLTLGQSVALKFLPEEASRNQRLLERFHGEVRVARLVSHPNVCRVYDIGEIEGVPFISMEYVDGEDLTSLLTRIGRLPADKALETSRKLCAGLNAAHERGVIHRDLKPQNIMINKRGEVVIMDFGLAAITDQLSGAEVRNGTPAYMAPEQLRGASVTTRSDIYALGLVLYELFTGRRPYDARNVQHLLDLQDSVHLTAMTSVAADIDPAVEKIIRRCLDPNPERRPGSPLAVAAALPGGDPLAAALAAGETPSPEMVAAAGKVEGMARKWAVLCLALVVGFFVAQIPVRGRRTALYQVPLENSPDVLAHLSRAAAAKFGYSRNPADSHITLQHRGDLIGHLRSLPAPAKWAQWYAAEAPLLSVYREALGPLDAAPYGLVTASNPAPLSTGMATVVLDGHGHLREFAGVPYAEGNPSVAPDAVFEAAGFDPAQFTETTPVQLPVRPFDMWRAWTGPHPVLPGTEVNIEAASWKGQISRVRVTLRKAGAAKAAKDAAANDTLNARLVFVRVLEGVGIFFVILLALRNWKLGRADLRGAGRVAAAGFLFSGLQWFGRVHPIAANPMLDYTLAAAADWLFSAAILFVVYTALEPAVRARWPHSMVTWNRVLSGRWGDAQVASDILIGGAVGAGMLTGVKVLFLFGPGGDPVNSDTTLNFGLGVRQWLGGHASTMLAALSIGLLIFLTIFGFRQILRRDWAAALCTAVVFTAMQGEVHFSADGLALTVVYLVIYGLLMFVLLRNGLVATISALFFANAGSSVLLGGSWTSWYVPAGLASLTLVVGISVWAFRHALGSRELIGDDA